MDEEMRARYGEVRMWLEGLYGDEAIPNFEVTEETVNHLHKLSEQSKKMNKLSILVHKDIEVKCTEYEVENARMKELLDGVGLPVFALSNAGKTSLKTLGQLAAALNIKDTKKSSFLLALNDLSYSRDTLNAELSKQREQHENQLKQVQSSHKGLQTVSEHYRNIAECSASDIPLTEKKKKDIAKMAGKTETYRQQLLDEIQNGGMATIEKHLHHQSLLRLGEELMNLKEELRALEVKYQRYRSLPPDLPMAKVKIEETKREIKKLEQELAGDIDYFARM